VDVSAQSVVLLLAVMLGIVALAGFVQLAHGLRRALGNRRPGAGDEAGAEAWLEEPAAVTDEAEQLCLERWQALLSGPGPGARWTGVGPAGGTEPAGAFSRPRRRRVLIGALMAAALPAGYLSWTLLQPPVREIDDPADVLELVSIDKWADAVSMFEDKLRVRFTYRNRGARRVDAFNVYMRLEDEPGRVVLQDLISVSNPVAPGQTSTWTQTYWGTCKQVSSPDAWAGLLQRDIHAYRIEWRPLGLVYDDGEGRTTLGAMPRDSMGETER